MKSEFIAIPEFQERVSPLIDVSLKYIIFETEDGEVKQKVRITVPSESEPQRIEQLKEIGVDTIICGAVSGYVANIIVQKGIRLKSMIYGPIDEVIRQYLNGSLRSPMPGMGRCGRRKKETGRCAGKGREQMPGKKNNKGEIQ